MATFLPFLGSFLGVFLAFILGIWGQSAQRRSLGMGPKTVKELAEELEPTSATVRDKLNQYKDRCFIQLESEGKANKWGLLATEHYLS